MKKTPFQILDEMNQDDTKNGTSLVAMSNTVIAADNMHVSDAFNIPANAINDINEVLEAYNNLNS